MEIARIKERVVLVCLYNTLEYPPPLPDMVDFAPTNTVKVCNCWTVVVF